MRAGVRDETFILIHALEREMLLVLSFDDTIVPLEIISCARYEVIKQFIFMFDDRKILSLPQIDDRVFDLSV